MDQQVFIYQGRIVSVQPSLTSSNDEISFQVDNSMVIAHDPALKGEIATYRASGMQFAQTEGYLPNLTRTNIMRKVISNVKYRDSLIAYISRFVDVASDKQIFAAIGSNDKDIDVARNLSKLPRKLMRPNERIDSRVHIVLNILLKVAHTPITSYLDIGTGDGTIAAAIGKRLEVEDIQGTDVFPMQRPIPTLTMKQEDRLPLEWNDKFQLVTAFSVLHHVKNQKEMLEDIHRVLAPGGIFIMREHDYVDDQFEWGPELEPKLLSVPERPFRLFLDAIHISSMAFTDEPAFWALYRARREWDTILMNEGMLYMYSNMRDVATNPLRTYESVYMKRPDTGVLLILEWRDTRSQRLDAFFPRLKGLDILDKIKEGVNYNEEILAYMTPWRKAVETSQLISKTIKTMYPLLGKFKLVDGTGGAGGNDIAFSLNRDISMLLIFERVPLFYNFIVNNLLLYTGREVQTAKSGQGLYLYNAAQLIYINNSSPELLRHRKDYYKDTVIFLDVPWEHEGAGYKLSGYKYEGSTLEDLSTKLLQMGALLVVLKLPPDYQLNIPHTEVTLAKETVYLVSQKPIELPQVSVPATRPTAFATTGIAGGNLAHEALRFLLMEYLKQLFLVLFPEKKLPVYYRWVYELLGLTDIRDPIIPATLVYKPSEFLQQGVDVPTSRVELLKLIKEKYPDLIPLTKFPPGNLTALLNLIATVASRGKLDNPANKLLFDLANQLKDQFDSVSDTPGMDAAITIRPNQVSVQPNATLLGILINLPGYSLILYPVQLLISDLKIADLRGRYLGSIFDRDLASLLLRYSNVMDNRNVNLHAAIPPTVFAALTQSSLKVQIEGFASPLNSTLDKYHSAFPDTDVVFGSLGNFLKSTILEGSYELNPPFTEETMESMVSKIEDVMLKGVYSFIVIVPNWAAAPALELMKASRYLRWQTVLPAGSHSYVVGDQHKQFKQVNLNIETAIFVLQSVEGSKTYPIPVDLRNRILVAFA